MIDASNPAARHVGRYLDWLIDTGGVGINAGLDRHIETALLDLVALSLGPARDVAAIAQKRGLRTARAQQIVAEIQNDFSRPNFSPTEVACKLGLSTRYVHALLQETGMSFTERVLELRLQKARAILVDPRNLGRAVNDIAYACGFNEVSYFNRRFRARFGSSPTQYRGGNGSVEKS